MRNVIACGIVLSCLSMLGSASTFAAEAKAAGAGDWPMFGHDAARTNATPVELRPPFERKWYRLFIDEGLMAGIQPVVAEGKVFVGTMKGTLYAIDAETGADAWTYKAGGPILHTCAAAGGKVFFGAADGLIYAVNIADGSKAWTRKTGAPIWNAPAVHDGLVVIGSRDGKLYGCDAANGEVKWTGATGGPILGSPAIDAKAGRTYVGSEDMRVYAFDLATGKQVWQSPKLPGVSFRGYHPVIAPDGSVMITVTPFASLDDINNVLMDMVKEVFGDVASWRHTKEENAAIRKKNFAQLADPAYYKRQMDYLRKRLTDEPALQTFFTLDPESGRPKFVAPIVYAESMNGTGMPPVIAPDGKVIVKYQALLRSRYEHYAPFLNVGYLDTKTGDITPIMDQSRTYGWHDSLLLVHDEQCALSAGGRVLFNTHQDNVNAMDLDTLKGYGEPLARNVHEAQPGVAVSLWAYLLRHRPLPVGFEWIARGTAVYGGGSAIDVPVSIAGDSFYYVPTHEINAGVAVIAYRQRRGPTVREGNERSSPTVKEGKPDPKESLTPDELKKILAMPWDWDTLGMNRLNITLNALPEKAPGTYSNPLEAQARAKVEEIPDADLDRVIWETMRVLEDSSEPSKALRVELARAVEELVSAKWRPLHFPAGKHPRESYRFFLDPTETLYTLALAWPHLAPELQAKVQARVSEMTADGGPLAGPTGRKTYDSNDGAIRSLYDPAPDRMTSTRDDLVRTDLARLYPIWFWAETTGDWSRLEPAWPSLRTFFNDAVARPEERAASSQKPDALELDRGNSRLAGLIAACRLAKRAGDEEFLKTALPATRQALRDRLRFELAHPNGGVLVPAPTLRTIFGRWRFLTPEVGRMIGLYAKDVNRHLVDVYVDYHRPIWWLAWPIEYNWRNECNIAFPTAAMEIFSARALILNEPGDTLAAYTDLPWCKADEYYIQKLALTLNNAGKVAWK